MDYGNLLVQRSTDFAPFGTLLFGSYTGPVAGSGDPRSDAAAVGPRRPRRLRGADDVASAARHAVARGADADRLRRPPGQHVRGRGRGAHDRRLGLPAGARPATNRARDRNLFYGIPAIGQFPFRGSAIEIWDSGPGRYSRRRWQTCRRWTERPIPTRTRIRATRRRAQAQKSRTSWRRTAAWSTSAAASPAGRRSTRRSAAQSTNGINILVCARYLGYASGNDALSSRSSTLAL